MYDMAFVCDKWEWPSYVKKSNDNSWMNYILRSLRQGYYFCALANDLKTVKIGVDIMFSF